MKSGKSLIPRIATLLIGSLGLALAGCGGGGSSGFTAPPTASITLMPTSFDFGTVTEGNLDEVPARRFTIRNSGTASYSLSSIRLEGASLADFNLDVSTGENPCGAAVRTLGPGDSCAVSVRFAPRDFGTFSADLAVQSNDPVAPNVSSALQGSYEEVDAEQVSVTVNQINACPRELPSKVFVSVRDQGGFPVRNLGLADFSLEEFGQGVVLDSVATVASANSTIALSILMDYSASITDIPETQENMEEAATLLVQRLGVNDEADIVKYAANVKFMLEDFSSDKAELLAAIAEDPRLVAKTALYDAVLAAVARTKDRVKDRRVIIALTDGKEDNQTDDGLVEVIGAALEADIPVFTVGFGDVDSLELGQLAAETSGIFYEPESSANLNAVYEQIANLLFDDQYVLSYASNLSAGESALLQVTVGEPFSGSGSKTSLACPAP